MSPTDKIKPLDAIRQEIAMFGELCVMLSAEAPGRPLSDQAIQQRKQALDAIMAKIGSCCGATIQPTGLSGSVTGPLGNRTGYDILSKHR